MSNIIVNRNAGGQKRGVNGFDGRQDRRKECRICHRVLIAHQSRITGVCAMCDVKGERNCKGIRKMSHSPSVSVKEG
jgi:hypothetical protein